jgi:hypothetical protein
VAGNEEGGVLTKKVILAAAATLAVMMLILLPASTSVSGAQFGIDGGKTLFGKGDTLADDDPDAICLYTDGSVYSATMKVVNSAGTTQSGAVYPTSYTFQASDRSKGLT